MHRNGRMLCLISTIIVVLFTVSASAEDVGSQAGPAVGAMPSSVTLSSNNGMVTLTPVTSEPGTDTQLQVQVQDPTGPGSAVTGTVSVAGFPVGRLDNLGGVAWQLSGNDLSGSVSGSHGGVTLASFNGTVNATGAQGTFTTVNGQGGSWVWTGPSPQQTATGTSE